MRPAKLAQLWVLPRCLVHHRLDRDCPQLVGPSKLARGREATRRLLPRQWSSSESMMLVSFIIASPLLVASSFNAPFRVILVSQQLCKRGSTYGCIHRFVPPV